MADSSECVSVSQSLQLCRGSEICSQPNAGLGVSKMLWISDHGVCTEGHCTPWKASWSTYWGYLNSCGESQFVAYSPFLYPTRTVLSLTSLQFRADMLSGQLCLSSNWEGWKRSTLCSCPLHSTRHTPHMKTIVSTRVCWVCCPVVHSRTSSSGVRGSALIQHPLPGLD